MGKQHVNCFRWEDPSTGDKPHKNGSGSFSG